MRNLKFEVVDILVNPCDDMEVILGLDEKSGFTAFGKILGALSADRMNFGPDRLRNLADRFGPPSFLASFSRPPYCVTLRLWTRRSSRLRCRFWSSGSTSSLTRWIMSTLPVGLPCTTPPGTGRRAAPSPRCCSTTQSPTRRSWPKSRTVHSGKPDYWVHGVRFRGQVSARMPREENSQGSAERLGSMRSIIQALVDAQGGNMQAGRGVRLLDGLRS